MCEICFRCFVIFCLRVGDWDLQELLDTPVRAAQTDVKGILKPWL